jgi:peptide subunit release factor 1 (eRF1)
VIAKQRLRELATLRPDGHKVLSLYVNLDPSEFPTPHDRDVEINALLDEIERGLKADGLNHAQKEELKRDIARLRSYFEYDFDASGIHGLAIFASDGAELFDVHRLERPIGSEAVIDDSPFIEPLTKLPGGDGYCVYLVDRRAARILAGSSERMNELRVLTDDVHGWHEQGGWSQSRYQRGIVKEARDHLKHAGDELFELFKGGRVQRLIVGTHQELRGDVESKLHSYLRERIVSWIDIDIKSSPSQVAEHVAGIITEDERQHERELLDRLRSELGRDSRGVSELAATLAALNERRVETLLVCDDFRAPGYATAASDFLSSEPGSSPTGEELQARNDVIEAAVESAIEQSAEIAVIRHLEAELEALGSIAALLRF